MIFGSVCSGIEAASVAWGPLGWRCAFVSEIDPFPSAVLAHHYPEIPNLGDFTRIGPDAGPIDLLVGGTPCQSFSVAGLRKGLADDRGNLAIEYLRLVGRMRPRWLVWENVPGVLSSNGGRDFGAFLGGLVELGYGWAYRVLDAQHFGVPQRRRRVFVVGHLGDWRRAVAVLFERESLCGHPAPRREAGSGVAGSLAGSPGRRCGQPDGGDTEGHPIASSGAVGEQLTGFELYGHSQWREGVGPLRAKGGDAGDGSETLVAHTLRADGFDASEDRTGRGTPLVPVPIDMRQASRGEKMTNNRAEGSSGGAPGAGIGEPGDPSPSIALSHPPAVGFIVNAAESCARQSHARPSEVARCLDSNGSFATQQGGTVVAQPFNIIGCAQKGRNHAYPTDTAGCLQHKGLAATGNEAGTVIGCDFRNMAETGDLAQTLQAGGHGASPSNPPHVASGMAVRRLTPLECERLQGFPDQWTLVPYRGKPAADGPRYKAIGNSMAVPVMAWIGQRIAEVESC